MFGHFGEIIFVIIVLSFSNKLVSLVIESYTSLKTVLTFQKTEPRYLGFIYLDRDHSVIKMILVLFGIFLVAVFGYQCFINLTQKAKNRNRSRSPTTAGTSQGQCKGRPIPSPINIDSQTAVSISSKKGVLKWGNHREYPHTMQLYNDGHTVSVVGRWDTTPTIEGEAVGFRSYEFSYMSFIWGATNCNGSEHTFDSKKYAMELHMVYIDNSGCGDQENYPLVIIAMLFELCQRPNTGFLQSVTSGLPKVICPFTTSAIPSFCLAMVVQAFSDNFYSYFGTYGVNDTAYYIIPTSIIPISCDQIDMFRRIEDPDGNPINSNKKPRNCEKQKVKKYESTNRC